MDMANVNKVKRESGQGLGEAREAHKGEDQAFGRLGEAC